MPAHRRILRPLGLAFFVLSAGLTVPLVARATEDSDRSGSTSAVFDEIVVDRIDGRAPATSVALERIGLQGAHVEAIGGGFDAVRLDEPVSAEKAAAIARALVATGMVAGAEPSGVRSSMSTVTDPQYSDQWYLQTSGTGVGIERAWDITVGSPDLVIAVIDTGRLDHPDLVSRLVPGYDFVFRTRDSKDGDGWDADETDLGDWSDSSDLSYNCGLRGGFDASSWHGTHIAGIIGATPNNGIGITGVNQRSRIQHVRVLGTCGGRTSDEAAAIRWAAGLPVPGVPNNATPARVINLSLGWEAACESVEQEAIDAATAAGAVIVVAAGNSGEDLSNTGFAPATCNNVITVAAVRNDGSRASYTNYGTPVDIAAPGGPIGILSTMNSGEKSADTSPAGWTYGYKQGTSMATPIVAGIVSLMLSVNPDLSTAQIEQILRDTARPFVTAARSCSSTPGAEYYCGAGVVDAAGAVAAAAQAASGVSVTRLEQSPADDIFATNLAVDALADRTDLILTSGSVYADGLAAAALAKQQNADIVLVPPSGLSSAQIAAIVAEAPAKVWILGGPQALPTTLETQLTAPLASGGAGLTPSTIERVFGETRYETATAVASRLGSVGTINGMRTAFVVRGDSFADAVIAGPATFGPADSTGSFPILLVHKDRLPDSVRTAIAALGITNVVVVGGTDVVSDETVRAIEALGVTTTRIAGSDRFATATALADFETKSIGSGGFGWNSTAIGLVDIADSSKGFDAISAIGVLGPNRRPLIGATSLQLPLSTSQWLTDGGRTVRTVTVVGSESALPPAVVDQVSALRR